MRFVCLIALLVSGVSGEMSGCVADSDGSRTCHGSFASGDVTSLLQMQTRQQDAEEHDDKLVAGSAKVTRRCLDQDAVDHFDPDCVMGDWTDWGDCTKTCGSGTRSRSRKEISGPADGGKCGCHEEAETCNSKECTVDCQMGEWSAWTACSKTCGGGTSSRSREVLSTPDVQGLCDCTKEAKACNKDDCVPIVIPNDVTTPAPVPTTPVPGVKLCVNVREAVNFENKIESAMVKLGEKEEKQSDSQGDACWDNVADGDYTLVATHKDYVKFTEKVSFVVSHTDVYGVDMVKETTGDWVIILKWGEEGMVDLDAYTWTDPLESACKVAYNQRDVTCKGIHGKLDQDHCFEVMENDKVKYTCTDGHSKGAKPETTTLTGVDGVDGEVVFQVANYWGSQMCYQESGADLPTPEFPKEDILNNVKGVFKQSKAEVTVYHGDQLVATFNAANDGHWMWSDFQCTNPNASAEEWWLFSINRMTGTVTPCDCTNNGGPGYCGGCGGR